MKSGDGIDKTYYRQRCPYCGLKYEDFRTGFSFTEVRGMFWSPSDDPRDWVYKRRRTVLGKWHEIKIGFWNEHIADCATTEVDEVPF